MNAVRREFPMPDLGEGLTEAEIVRWLVSAGDYVEVDQPLVEVETAKTTVQIPSPYAGEILECRGAVGATHAVGAALVVIAEPSRAPAEAVRPRPPTAASHTAEGPVPVVSPLVRRIAREHGIDLRTVPASGPSGLVGRSDVMRAISLQGGPANGAVAGTSSHTGAFGRFEDGPAADGLLAWHGTQRAAARKVTASHREIPAATCWVEADATELLDLCHGAGGGTGPRAGLLGLVGRMCVAALQRHPELGSRVVHGADGTAMGVRPPETISLGVATSTDRGVVVPVVHDAGRFTEYRLAAEIDRLVRRARDGTLTPEELTGGCFTLNNYGALGVDGAVPLINHPETAMLGVGRIIRRPWVVGNAVVPRSVAPLALTFDHRVCDGDTAAAFLNYVAEAMTSPTTMLRRP